MPYPKGVGVRIPVVQNAKQPVSRSSGLLAALFLAAALALGGGGSPNPLPEMILEILAAVTVVLWTLGLLRSPSFKRVPLSAWVIAIIIAAIPILQLIPLPPFIWQALPGRKIEYDALALIGEQSNWRTWSLAPARTLSSVLSLGPPLLLLTMTSALDEKGRLAVIRSVALMAVATLIFGALQHSASDGSPIDLYGVGGKILSGFQANNNATADLMLIALMSGPLLVRTSVTEHLIPDKAAVVLTISAVYMVICAVAVVLTSSRAGIALLPIPILASLWILRRWIRFTPRVVLTGLLAMLIAGPICVVLARANPLLASVIARFDFANELRPQLWRDGLFVAQTYFPFGVGMGDFVPALVADERLQSVQQTMPNRAHNELIELIAETGVFGLMALSATLFLLIREVFRKVRSASRESIGIVCFASTALIVLSVHSMVDYPLRSLSLASLAAACAGLLLARSRDPERALDARPAPLLTSK